MRLLPVIPLQREGLTGISTAILEPFDKETSKTDRPWHEIFLLFSVTFTV